MNLENNPLTLYIDSCFEVCHWPCLTYGCGFHQGVQFQQERLQIPLRPCSGNLQRVFSPWASPRTVGRMRGSWEEQRCYDVCMCVYDVHINPQTKPRGLLTSAWITTGCMNVHASAWPRVRQKAERRASVTAPSRRLTPAPHRQLLSRACRPRHHSSSDPVSLSCLHLCCTSFNQVSPPNSPYGFYP